MRAPPDNLVEFFPIDVPGSDRAEPTAYESARAAVTSHVQSEEPTRLDPERSTVQPDEPRLPASRQRPLSIGLIGSLAIHLLPLLILLDWSIAPAELAQPIPVQLVVEIPPPAPPTEEPQRPPPGRLASKEMGEMAPQPDRAASAPARDAEQPDESRMAAVPPPKPSPPPELVSALPKPTPPTEAADIPRQPEPTPPVKPPAKQPVAARIAPNPHPAP